MAGGIQIEGREAHGNQVWCVIPVYNNARTLREVAVGCRAQMDHVLVVDDGSTDAQVGALLEGTDVTILSHDRNRGKGAAILTATDYVRRHGGTHIITIDADGQHSPNDLSKFLAAIREDGTAIIVGCRGFETENVPRASRFGRRFSNMWIRLETGLELHDTQSGFRAYPVHCLTRLRLRGRRYDFEVEVLTRAAWAGVPVREVDVGVTYAAPGQRVSHFRPVVDNLRISRMHARLVGRRLLPFRH